MSYKFKSRKLRILILLSPLMFLSMAVAAKPTFLQRCKIAISRLPLLFKGKEPKQLVDFRPKAEGAQHYKIDWDSPLGRRPVDWSGFYSRHNASFDINERTFITTVTFPKAQFTEADAYNALRETTWRTGAVPSQRFEVTLKEDEKDFVYSLKLEEGAPVEAIAHIHKALDEVFLRLVPLAP